MQITKLSVIFFTCFISVFFICKAQYSFDTLALANRLQEISSDKFDNTGHRYDDVLPWEEATPEALLANDQLQMVIEESFQQLPAQQRAALSLYDMEGIEMKEICNILDVSASNVRVLLHRARTTLHQSIEKYQDNK